MKPEIISERLLKDLSPLRFGPPVSHIYNPLEYARAPYEKYWNLYGRRGKRVVMLGMNPGPWGMVQTGIPFGEISAVRDWLGITAPVGTPHRMHLKRPVEGFDCKRSEVSGKRLWGWAQDMYKTPEKFFARFFVINYCPLVFMEKSGRNRTPNNLPAKERGPLFSACDLALKRTVEYLKPGHVVGVGKFAEQRARHALAGMDIPIGGIAHPSPANPKANRGWADLITRQLKEMGIKIRESKV
jgi:single-strand selective monofunctional uracil DNA glycosylase